MTKTFSCETHWHIPRQRRLAPRDKLRMKQWQEPGSTKKKQCQAAHPPAYDQWNLTVYYLSIPCQPVMKGLIVSDRLWSAHRLFWNVNWRKKERAPWRVACRGEKGTPPSEEINATPVRHVSSGAWWILRNKKKVWKHENRGKRAPSLPFLPPFAHPCLSDHHLPPLFCQRPSWWLLSEVRISFVVWCFAVATVEMLPSSAYAQVGEGGVEWKAAVGWRELARRGCLWYLLILTHLWE